MTYNLSHKHYSKFFWWVLNFLSNSFLVRAEILLFCNFFLNYDMFFLYDINNSYINYKLIHGPRPVIRFMGWVGDTVDN